MLVAILVSAFAQDVSVVYEQFAGLHVKIGGVPFIEGSSFRYSDKSGKSLYSSRWAPKEVARLPDGSIRVRYSGDNGNAIGTHTYLQTATGLTARYEFRWRGSEDVVVDHTFAQIWAPSIAHGEVEFGSRTLPSILKPVNGDWAARRLGASNEMSFFSTLASVDFKVRGSGAAFYDARGYGQDWAKGNCLFWLGTQGLVVHPGQTTEITVDWVFSPKLQNGGGQTQFSMQPQSSRDALAPPSTAPLLIPKPKSMDLNGLSLPLRDDEREQGPLESRFASMIARRWRVDPAKVAVDIESQVGASDIVSEGYEITIDPSKVRIRAGDLAGERYALGTLAQMVQPRAGTLALPCGTVHDWPSVKSRGVHFFAGQNCLPFQSEWISRVLAPMRFNNAVIECSRTKWDALPEAESKAWVTRTDLANLFSQCRTEGLEPIPLIQSLGHMDWLLDGEHKRLAVNEEVPYTLDVRKTKAKELLESIWEEAVDLLKPKIVHFGMDEISMRGMPDDPSLGGRLWKLQIPELMAMAKKWNARPMVWGDMMLSKENAGDATHAASPTAAQEFRSSLKPGTLVGDWHYLSTSDPNKFKSLPLWKTWGFSPVATSWYRLDNIRSHTLKAIEVGAGTLQSTWAGYATNEASLLGETEQFAAHIAAADYAWSGRTDTASGLGYQTTNVLRQLLYGWPEAVRAVAGDCWVPVDGAATPMRIGSVAFKKFETMALNTPLSQDGILGAQTIKLSITTKAKEIFLLVDCIGWQTDGERVAEVSLSTLSGAVKADILYGADVRALEDARPAVRVPSAGGLSVLRIKLGDEPVDLSELTINVVSRTAGLRLHGVTTL